MFGTPSSTPAFGTPSSTPAFGTPSSTPAFGSATTTPPFGTPSSAFGTPSFATPSSTPAFGTPSSSSFATGFGSSLFSSPFTSQTPQQQQPQQNSLFSQSGLGFPQQQQQQQTSLFSTPQSTPYYTPQLTTQMAPVAPLPFSLADRDIQAIVDAYKEGPANPKHAFKYLLFSVIDPQHRVKPAGVSDIMWAEAMAKLEGMESADRERLWPQLVQGFKDLSNRLKIQDEVIVSDGERLRKIQSSVKMFQGHFQAETLPWIEKLRQKEQSLQRRLLRVMKMLEALEGKGCRLPLTMGEAELAEKLAAITRQLKGSGAELSRRVQYLLSVTRLQANEIGAGSSFYLPGSAKIHEHSLSDMHEVLQQQTEAIARLGNVLKRDARDMEIIMDEDSEMTDGVS